jgi:hypothetical protein
MNNYPNGFGPKGFTPKGIIGTILALFGFVVGGVIAVKIARFLFGATLFLVMLCVIVLTSIITKTVLTYQQDQFRHEINKIEVTEKLQTKEQDAVRAHILKLNEVAMEREKLAKQQRLAEIKLHVTAAEEIEHKWTEAKELAWKSYNDVQRTYLAAIKLHEETHNPDLFNRILELKKQLNESIPSQSQLSLRAAEIRKEVFIAYGITQDPLASVVADEPRQEVEIIIPEPSTGFSPSTILQQKFASPTIPQPQSRGAQRIIQQRALENRYGLRR